MFFQLYFNVWSTGMGGTMLKKEEEFVIMKMQNSKADGKGGGEGQETWRPDMIDISIHHGKNALSEIPM
jgi:hypothetical protein